MPFWTREEDESSGGSAQLTASLHPCLAYSAPWVPKNFFNSLPLAWLILFSGLFWGVITSTISAAEPSITGVKHTLGGKVAFDLGPNPSRYHILQRSRELSEVSRGRPVAMVRGSSRPGIIADSSRPKDQGYYQLTDVDSAAPRILRLARTGSPGILQSSQPSHPGRTSPGISHGGEPDPLRATGSPG